MQQLLEFMAVNPNATIALIVILAIAIGSIAIRTFQYIQEDNLRQEASTQPLQQFIDRHQHYMHKEELTAYWHHVQKIKNQDL